MPKPRSGHTLTWVGQNKYLMYGGIEDNETNRIVSTPDVWQLTVSACKYKALHFRISFFFLLVFVLSFLISH